TPDVSDEGLAAGRPVAAGRAAPVSPSRWDGTPRADQEEYSPSRRAILSHDECSHGRCSGLMLLLLPLGLPCSRCVPCSSRPEGAPAALHVGAVPPTWLNHTHPHPSTHLAAHGGRRELGPHFEEDRRRGTEEDGAPHRGPCAACQISNCREEARATHAR